MTTQLSRVCRFIGIHHRVKKTKENEAHPTIVVILKENGKYITIELETEDDEMKFAHRRHVTKWRDMAEDEDLSMLDWSWRFVQKNDDLLTVKSWPQEITEIDGKKVYRVGDSWQARVTGKGDKQKIQVAVSWEGLTKGDVVTVISGGSGGNFTYALSRRAEDVDALVQRCSPKTLEESRNGREKIEDALTLAEMGRDQPHLTNKCEIGDRNNIDVRALWFALDEVMDDRIKCESRLRARLQGERFRRADGGYPEGAFEDALKDRMATDVIYQAYVLEEKEAEKRLAKAFGVTSIWPMFCGENYKGCGTRIAARFVSGIVDIRRFEVKPNDAEMHRLKVMVSAIEQEFASELDAIGLADCPFTNKGQQKYWKLQKLHSAKLKQLAQRFPHDFDRIPLEGCPHQDPNMQKLWKWQKLQEQKLIERNPMAFVAERIGNAVKAHKKRHELRNNAMQKGAGRLGSFSGAVPKGGQLMRRRTGGGDSSQYNDVQRKAFWLIAEQWNRAPKTYWGQKLLVNKARLRVIHPEKVITEKGTSKYSDGHILKMAKWRTITQFCHRLFADWVNVEGRSATEKVSLEKAA